MADSPQYDVAIIGGGPGGSTTGALLRKYHDAKVVICERESFPREHVGESQLPPIGGILHEMGCWDAVEAAQFPIKVGVTYRWGSARQLWDFDFIPGGAFLDAERPAPYAGQRTRTAFQVDRAVYDQILLDQAGKLGCEVRQQTKVAKVERDGDRVTGLQLASGERIEARWYVDASGHGGVLRRALDVPIHCPAQLKNVAVWDYWNNIEWADTIGVGGTRVQVLSVGFGWIWFIPVSPTRASIGLICAADYYKRSGRSLQELYDEALQIEPRVRELTANATMRGMPSTTKDWSFVSERAYGDNWFLVGEAVGFADPILAAGMTLTQTGGRELAYTLRALLTGAHDEAWLKRHYEHNQRVRIVQHIRFADFWYAANGQFTDLQQECARIAADAGFRMDAEDAWQWLSQGGFANDVPGQLGVGGLDLTGTKQITQRLAGSEAKWHVSSVNVVRLQLDDAEQTTVPYYRGGEVKAVPAYVRGDKQLLVVGVLGLIVKLMAQISSITALLEVAVQKLVQSNPSAGPVASVHAAQAIEYLLSEGWATGTLDPALPRLDLSTPDEGPTIHKHKAIQTGVTQSRQS